MKESEPPAPLQRLHPITPLFEVLTGLRQAWPIVLALLFGRADATQVIAVAGLSVILARGVLRWWRTTYALGPDALRLNEGLLSRRQRTVPYDRVQQVDVVRKLRHRALGVAQLRIETAGGKGAEVSLDVLSLPEAERVRSHIDRSALPSSAAMAPPAGAVPAHGDGAVPAPAGGAVPAPAAPPVTPATTLVHLSLWEVVLAGVTGAKLLVVLGVAGAIFNMVDEVPGRVLPDPDDVTLPAVTAFTVAGLVLVAVFAWFATAAAASVFSDYGFRLSRRDDRFVVERGLLERRQVAIEVRRLQVVTVSQSPLRRLLDRAAVQVHSAAGRFVVPLVRSAGATVLVLELTGAAGLPILHPAPPVARRRAVVRRVVPVGVVALVCAALWWPAGGLAAPLVPIAGAAGWAAWRALAHGADHRLVVARHGALQRRLVVVPTTKSQSTRVRAGPFQRRAGLATLLVDVAGGPSARIPEIDVGRAVELARGLATPTAGRMADDRTTGQAIDAAGS